MKMNVLHNKKLLKVLVFGIIFLMTIPQTKAQQDYGTRTEISYEVITAPSPLLLKGTKIKYNGAMYEIEAIQDWNNSILPCLQFVIKKVN